MCEASSVPNGVDCAVVFSAVGSGCDDSDLTTSGDVCDGAGGCAGVPIACPVSVCVATSTPDGAGCADVFEDAGVGCDDGDVTTASDVCDGAGACSGTDIVCAAGPCIDSAEPNGTDCTVVYEPAGSGCDDLKSSTHTDVCNGGGTCLGVAYACPTSACVTASVANGADCSQTFADAGAACDDGDVATGDDACDGSGTCGGTAIVCAAGQCDVSSAPDGVGCVVVFAAKGLACDDGDPDTADDACAAGACAGTPIACPAGQCVVSSSGNGASCDTVFADAGVACDDLLIGTGGDVCDGMGGCAGAPIVCAPQLCKLATPNGVDCTYSPAGVGSGCDDGVAATHSDVCDAAGACAGTGYSCTAGTCEASSTPDGVACAVVFSGAGTACNDSDVSTGSDVCDGAGGCSGSPIDCTPTQCVATATPNGSGCDVTFKGAGAACDDGSAATSGDQCDGSGLCVGSLVDCPVGACTESSTPNRSGGCDVVHKANGSPCDDGEPCTASDSCSGGACSGGGAKDCDDDNACTQDSCIDGVGCSYAVVTCTDQNACTDDVCDPGLGCLFPENHCGNDLCDCGETTGTCSADCLPSGSPDPEFGGGDGVVVSDFVLDDDEAVAAALMGGGKILVGGRVRHATQGYNFLVAQYLPDGELDPNFGENGGFTQTDLGDSKTDRAYAMAVGPNRIVTVGHGNVAGSGQRFAIVVYKLDGTLDTTFDAGGSKPGTRLLSGILASSSTLYGALVNADGTISVAGSGYPSVGDPRLAAARLLPSGVFDVSFASNGHTVLGPIQEGEDSGVIARNAPGGSLYVVGETEWGYDDDLVSWTLLADGTPDGAWGTDGVVRYDASPGHAGQAENPLDSAEGVGQASFDAAGGMLVSGSYQPQVPGVSFVRHIAVYRFLPGGTPDPDFGTNGLAYFDSPGFDAGFSHAVQADGRIVVCGSVRDASNDQIVAAVRFMPNGAVDTSFGTNGLQKVVTPGLGFADAKACLVQPDGKIVLVGDGYNGSDNDIIIIRIGQ